MSKRYERRLEGKRRKLRKELAQQYRDGAALVATRQLQDQPGRGRLVSVSEAADGRALVRVVEFEASDWDNILNESERIFADLDDAFNWIETNCGEHWWELRGPESSGKTC